MSIWSYVSVTKRLGKPYAKLDVGIPFQVVAISVGAFNHLTQQFSFVEKTSYLNAYSLLIDETGDELYILWAWKHS